MQCWSRDHVRIQLGARVVQSVSRLLLVPDYSPCMSADFLRLRRRWRLSSSGFGALLCTNWPDSPDRALYARTPTPHLAPLPS